MNGFNGCAVCGLPFAVGRFPEAPRQPISPIGPIRDAAPRVVLGGNRKQQTANGKRQTANRKPLTANPSKPDLRPIDLGASLDEELFQGRSIKRTVFFGIHSQENLATGLEEPFL